LRRNRRRTRAAATQRSGTRLEVVLTELKEEEEA
jgi:hypothetical protein